MMITRSRAAWTAIALPSVLTIALAFAGQEARAEAEEPPGPDRFTIVDEAYTSYEWWLTAWADNQAACSLFIDHEGLPSGGEIYEDCGQSLYEKWLLTRPCLQDGGELDACSGYYLVFIQSEPATRQVGVALPPPVVWVSLDGCVPYRSTFRCLDLPELILNGEEPLSGETITHLAGTLSGESFTCDSPCRVKLIPTGLDGLLVRFWAYSSYGDSSLTYEARVRVTAVDDPADESWYVDVLSSQWRGEPLAGCSQTWEAFPTVGGVPDWLSTPLQVQDLHTDLPYEYLAAHLVASGGVEAAGCENGGLDENGLVTPCGLSAARASVADWQNRFDDLILRSAGESGIPARLLKNIFSRESQFWPGISKDTPEAGLGQMTENGADTTLLWNPSFYEQFCPTVLEEAVCQRGYPQLSGGQQASLRRALVESVDAFCPDCPLGIDLTRAKNSIGIFSETLAANCAQAGIIVRNTYGRAPGAVAVYEDLWRFTLVNYNAGPGCLTLAIQETKRLGENLDWERLSSHLTPACVGALDYVTDISLGAP